MTELFAFGSIIFFIIFLIVSILMPFFILRIRNESVLTNQLLRKINDELKIIRLNIQSTSHTPDAPAPATPSVSSIEQTPHGLKIVKETPLKSYPHSGSQLVCMLLPDTEVTPTGDKRDEWQKVTVTNGKFVGNEGWIHVEE